MHSSGLLLCQGEGGGGMKRYGTNCTCLVSIIGKIQSSVACAGAISDAKGANRNIFPTAVYDRELVCTLPSFKMTFKFSGDVDCIGFLCAVSHVNAAI